MDQLAPQTYPRGFALVPNMPDPSGFVGVASRLLLMVRTTFRSIGHAPSFEAQLGDASGTKLLRLKLGQTTLGSLALQRPRDTDQIADLVARDLATISSESVDLQGVTHVSLQLRGFTVEEVLEVDRWRLPLGGWSVAGGAVDRVTIGVLGFK